MKNATRKMLSIAVAVVMLVTVMSVSPVSTVEVEASGFTPRLTAPNFNTFNSGNPFPYSNGNCTWYAWARAREILGHAPNIQTFPADARLWWQNNINRNGYPRGQEPRLGAIACWGGGQWGHIAVVEAIQGDRITISESNWGGPAFRTFTGTMAQIRSRAPGGFQGFIYIGNFSVTPPPPPANQVNIANGIYSIQGRNSGRFVDILGRGTGNGVQAVIWDWYNGNNQKFRFTRQTDGTYSIVAVHSGRALTVENISHNQQANVQQWDWAGSDHQRWYVVNRNGWFGLVAKHSGQSMDVLNNGLANGTRIVQQQSSTAGSQQFRLIPQWLPTASANIPNGVYAIRGRNSGRFVDILGGGTGNGVQAGIWDWTNSNNQKFRFTRQNDGTYSIIAVNSGRALTVQDVSLHQQKNVIQWDWNGSDHQRWFVVDSGDGWFKLVARHSGQAMDVLNNGLANGTRIVQQQDSGANSQRFRLVCQGAHHWGGWVTTRAATCAAAGARRRTCTICRAEETGTIARLSHNWSAWVTTRAATTTRAGTRERTCRTCNQRETGTIARLNAPPTNGTNRNPTQPGNTGNAAQNPTIRRPSRPANFRITRSGRRARLTWRRQAGVRVQIQQRVGNGRWRTVRNTAAGANSWRSANLRRGSRNSYRIRAFRNINGRRVNSTWTVVRRVNVPR